MWKLLHVCFRCEAGSIDQLLASVFDSRLTHFVESLTDRLVRHTTNELIDLIDMVCEFDEEKVKWLSSNAFPRVLVSLFCSPNWLKFHLLVDSALTMQQGSSFRKKWFCLTCISVEMRNLNFWPLLPGNVLIPMSLIEFVSILIVIVRVFVLVLEMRYW
jgi:hypothetical protein